MADLDFEQARALALQGSTRLEIVAEATLEREWGWVFVLDGKGAGAAGKVESLIGMGPCFVNRSDGTLSRFGSDRPAQGWIEDYERARAGGGIAGWWKVVARPWLRGRPRASPSPRMPNDQDEADRAWRCWDRLNGRYTFAAAVELESGVRLPKVLFDSDTNIAVEEGGVPLRFRFSLLGRRIARLERTPV